MSRPFLAGCSPSSRAILTLSLPEYRYGGTSTGGAIRSLYKDGGVRRFYRGMAPALIQGPMSRFGDTAANAGSLALLGEFDSTKNLPVGVKTGVASTCAAGWRIFLMRTLSPLRPPAPQTAPVSDIVLWVYCAQLSML